MGNMGQGAPAFHDALRVIPGSGNPPDPLRWTLHLLWFAVLTRPGCPSLSDSVRRDFQSPTAKPEGLGPSYRTTPG
jgi:hypothetical protein